MDWREMGVNHNPSFKELKEMVESQDHPFIFYHIGKDEILDKDTSGIDNFISNVKKIGKPLRQRCSVFCGGYDEVPEELFEIKEVREFTKLIFKKHPYLLYYIETEMIQTQKWLISCIADELFIVKNHDEMSIIELEQKYGFDNLPQLDSHVTFKNKGLTNLLSPIISHAKKNKDAKNGKKIAYSYAVLFDETNATLDELGITEEDLK